MGAYLSDHAVAQGLLGATLAVWLGLELRQGARRRPGAQRHDRGSGIVLRLCLGIAWAVTALAAADGPSSRIGGGAVPFVGGLACMWTGLALRGWAVRTLGEYFTVTVKTSADQPVISSGPYRWLRHPSYSGAELIFVGVGFVTGTWIGVASLVVLPMIGLANRIRVEERALEAALGAPYRSFAIGRKRMIPFIW